MAQVSAREVLAGVALAPFIHRTRIILILRLFDDYTSETGEQVPVTSITRGEYAIHHVDAAGHVFGQLFRHPDTHHVARPVFGQKRRGPFRHFETERAGLAYRESADRIAVGIEFEELFDAVPP